MTNISTQIEEIEIILRHFEQKSLKPEEVQIEVDRQIKPIELILNNPGEKKNGNEFDQAIKYSEVILSPNAQESKIYYPVTMEINIKKTKVRFFTK